MADQTRSVGGKKYRRMAVRIMDNTWKAISQRKEMTCCIDNGGSGMCFHSADYMVVFLPRRHSMGRNGNQETERVHSPTALQRRVEASL